MAYCGEMGPKSARVKEYFAGKKGVDCQYNSTEFIFPVVLISRGLHLFI